MEKIVPDYKRIYNDIIVKEFPEKRDSCQRLLQKESLSVMDIMKLNEKIFGIPDKETFAASQKHRSFMKKDILKMLDYQKKNKLNNTQFAIHFKLSPNTVTKWKKSFLI
ncbi:helix-turn-helix domain-containing protein [Chryseobacterium cucumeris]